VPISAYARQLREKVGHDLLYWPAAACLVGDGEGRLLFVRQVGGHTWSLPAGAIDPGETPAEAARRETREEASVEVRLTGLAGVFGGGATFHRYYPNGDEIAWVTIAFHAQITSGLPAPDNKETSEVRWATLDEAQTLDLAPSTRHVLERVTAGQRFDP
jgi:8-oxo-dGTP pyrophosphatase MutT (NUDIX family)